MHRLRHVTTKTTKLYVALHEENSSVKRPAYIELNPQRTHAIATIFSLRSGNPQLAAIQKFRHNGADDKCSCGQTEDIPHFIEEWKLYEEERTIIENKLRGQVLLQLSVLDCCLSSSKYEKKLSSMTKQRQRTIDNAIKTYMEKCTKIRLEKLQSAL